MADTKLTALTADSTPAATGLLYYVDDPGGTPVSRKTTVSEMNVFMNSLGAAFGPDGTMKNGKLAVTVASNNITVALKTLAGSDPSASDPVYVRINGTIRTCTAALAVTKNAATNWFNSGGAELATKEIDYFAYLIWNTTPATDIVDIGFARVPYFSVYSEASSTTTNEKYLAYANGSAPTSTDDMVVIGRFAATLSATAAFNWSVPTFTTTNLIQRPFFETRALNYTPTIVGYSSNPTNTVYSYSVKLDECTVKLAEGGAGTSNATTLSYTSPFTAKTLANMQWIAGMRAFDNSAGVSTPVMAILNSASGTINIYKDFVGAVWTNSGTKRIISGSINFNL
jgi:hypothetical protein